MGIRAHSLLSGPDVRNITLRGMRGGLQGTVPLPHGCRARWPRVFVINVGLGLILKGGLWSPREDIATLEQKFKKSYIDEKYPLDEAEKKFAEWDKLTQQLFIRRK